MLPLIGPLLQCLYLCLRVRITQQNLSKCCVVNGPHHARNVLERTLLEAPFIKRHSWLTFEVDYHEVTACEKHLTEMVVAVHARLLARYTLLINFRKAR